MATFRITATDIKGKETVYLFSTEYSEILDESTGQYLGIPRLIPGEEEANAAFISEPFHKEIKYDEHYHYRKNLVNKLNSFDTPYLSDEWGSIRLFTDKLRTGKNIELPNNQCGTCPFISLCSNYKTVESSCSDAYSDNAARFSALFERLTNKIPLSIEAIDVTQREWFKWLRNPFYNEVNDIIYIPLDLGMVPPVISEHSLFSWLKQARDDQDKVLKEFDRSKTIYDSGYDTKTDMAYVNAITHPVTGEWFAGFEKEFPELVEFFDKYPLVNKRIMTIVNKRIMTITTTEDIEVYAKKTNFKFHKDWDSYTLGFRFYAVVDPKPKLLFRDILKEYIPFYKKRLELGQRFNVPKYHTNNTYAANTLVGPHAWCLNVLDMSHAAIDVHENRSVFILYGEIDFIKLDEIIYNSFIKYPTNIFTKNHLSSARSLHNPELGI